MKSLIKKAGLNSDYSTHTMRHTFATLLLKSDTPMKIVQYLLGHSVLSTTSDIYSHPNMVMQKEPISKLGNLIAF